MIYTICRFNEWIFEFYRGKERDYLRINTYISQDGRSSFTFKNKHGKRKREEKLFKPRESCHKPSSHEAEKIRAHTSSCTYLMLRTL